MYVTCSKPILSKFIKINTKTTCEEHVYECVHVHVHVYVHIHVHIHVHVHVHIHVHVYVHVCVCVCVSVFLISLYGAQRSSYLALHSSLNFSLWARWQDVFPMAHTLTLVEPTLVCTCTIVHVYVCTIVHVHVCTCTNCTCMCVLPECICEYVYNYIHVSVYTVHLCFVCL